MMQAQVIISPPQLPRSRAWLDSRRHNDGNTLPTAAIVSNEALAGAEPDGALLALGVQFEPIFAEWVALEIKSIENQRKFEEFVERRTGVKFDDRARRRLTRLRASALRSVNRMALW